jgi:ribosome-associated protein
MARAEKRQKAPRLPAQVAVAVTAAEDKKATDLVILDLRKTAGFTDFFMICSGSNPRQVRAIAEGIQDALVATGARPSHIEGSDKSGWILLDYFDFIVHVFAPDTRIFYDLERLWGNAERVETQAPEVGVRRRRHESPGDSNALADAEDRR